MKKYIIPSVKVANIRVSTILAGSPDLKVDPTQGSDKMQVRKYFDIVDMAADE